MIRWRCVSSTRWSSIPSYGQGLDGRGTLPREHAARVVTKMALYVLDYVTLVMNIVGFKALIAGDQGLRSLAIGLCEVIGALRLALRCHRF